MCMNKKYSFPQWESNSRPSYGELKFLWCVCVCTSSLLYSLALFKRSTRNQKKIQPIKMIIAVAQRMKMITKDMSSVMEGNILHRSSQTIKRKIILRNFSNSFSTEIISGKHKLVFLTWITRKSIIISC